MLYWSYDCTCEQAHVIPGAKLKKDKKLDKKHRLAPEDLDGRGCLHL
jgi:hypothetical protein